MAFASLEATHLWYQKYRIDADGRDFTNAINTNCICILQEFGSDAQNVSPRFGDWRKGLAVTEEATIFQLCQIFKDFQVRAMPKETSEHDYELEWYQGESDSVPKVKGVFLKVDICIFAPREDGAGVTALEDSGFDEGGVISTAMELVLDSETASCAEITGPLEVKPMNVLPGQTQMHPAHRQSPAPTSSLESEPTPRYNLQSIQDLGRRLDLLAVNERVDALEARTNQLHTVLSYYRITNACVMGSKQQAGPFRYPCRDTIWTGSKVIQLDPSGNRNPPVGPIRTLNVYVLGPENLLGPSGYFCTGMKTHYLGRIVH
ncbi:hypothetical protein C8R48DRAFT_675554 [Suillus tomentosus]|nr:hypothetical protein C8R48DRAFT_675554 [Suillus tomentosus]